VISAAVVPIVAMHHGAQKTDFRSLYRANSVLDKLTTYWAPRIEEAYKGGDTLASTFLNIFAPFVRLVLNADVFRTWLIRQKQQSKDGQIDTDNARQSLTSEEATCIGLAVQAAEEMLYYLSAQSKGDGAARRHDWAPRDMTTGHRPGLNLDAEVARTLSGSIDQILLIVFAFPPLFLAQLRASNLVNCDLDMAPEITNDLYSSGLPAKSLLPASKFMRLMELSAEFYEATAPNGDFPSIEQATLLRSISCMSVPVDGPPPPDFSQNGAGNTQQQYGQSCVVPGVLNADQTGTWGLHPSQASKTHQEYMQHIEANMPGTNTSLAYPYNQMVYSHNGADRLDAMLQNTMADPTTATSLLGSFTKVDADWNAFFSSAALNSNNYVYSDNGSAPGTSSGTGMPLDVFGNNFGGSGVPGFNALPAGLASTKYAGQSPDSVNSFFTGGAGSNNGYNVSNSPVQVPFAQMANNRQRLY
jgi:hypothetical protein